MTGEVKEEFRAYPKIARLNREIVITEKIDGTNAGILIGDDGKLVHAQSRNRVLRAGEADNFGFGAWVRTYADKLEEALGPGMHYGEWWGAGIGRRYGMTTKAFSLFNVKRWADLSRVIGDVPVRSVPVLYEGPWLSSSLHFVPDNWIQALRMEGSRAAPGFMKPEGIVIFHTASSQLFKVTIENDEKPKGAKEE